MSVRFGTLCILLSMILPAAAPVSAQDAPFFRIAIHGGAGTIRQGDMTDEVEAAYRDKLREALQAGYRILADHGSSLDAVMAAVQVLEDSPLFNSGRGAVFTHDGIHELDASIMNGEDGSAGAVAGVRTVKSPIALARRVLEASPHVLLVGRGAEAFAREQGLDEVDNTYFDTDRRRRQLQRLQEREGETGRLEPHDFLDRDADKFGTVGAVAVDRRGNLAAATSTGGMTNKRWGRVGDSPIIGAGTYADNATCAVSATGHGEYFIRGVIAYDIAAMMRYAGLTVEEAASAVIHGKLSGRGGTGGVIAMDREGRVTMPFNTAGMYRGHIDHTGKAEIAIFNDE